MELLALSLDLPDMSGAVESVKRTFTGNGMTAGGLVLVAFLAGLAFAATPVKSKADRVLKNGFLTSLDYTLMSADAKVLETSKGREPLKYIHGQKMMIPGLV